eukprot:4992995-Alexandrium_andersonii.AAC.1
MRQCSAKPPKSNYIMSRHALSPLDALGIEDSSWQGATLICSELVDLQGSQSRSALEKTEHGSFAECGSPNSGRGATLH